MLNIRKSPTFAKPPDLVNDTSRFAEPKLNSYEQMIDKLEKSQIPTSLEILLQNKLGTYLNDMIKKDPFKMISKPSKEREERWEEDDPKYRR